MFNAAEALTLTLEGRVVEGLEIPQPSRPKGKATYMIASAARAAALLSDAFAQDTLKQTQWQAFLRKNRLEALTLDEVIAALGTFMLPVIEAANVNAAFPCRWQAGGPWSPAEAG